MKLSDIHLTLSEIRKERSLAQKDIADALNVEQAAISMYENGKRGIPLDILDEWLRMLEIEVKIIPKGFEPVKTKENVEQDLELFNVLKKRRNYLIAEMRTIMAGKINALPGLQKEDEETGESLFWPYSFPGAPDVGVIETRCDHPAQRCLAVEYAENEVNVYKFLTTNEAFDGQSDQEWLNVNRLYFTEDDFLRLSGQLEQESMELRKVTILRRNDKMPDGVEVAAAGGFSVRTLLEMQNNFASFSAAKRDAEDLEEYRKMEAGLDEVNHELIEIAMTNRLKNGALAPEFIFWTEKDVAATEVPLWGQERGWKWIEEGVEWIEDYQEMQEIRLSGDNISHEHLFPHTHENDNRIIGLIGEDKKPAVFMSDPNRPNVIYRVETDVVDLNEDEASEYRSILKATEELERLRTKED